MTWQHGVAQIHFPLLSQEWCRGDDATHAIQGLEHNVPRVV